MVRCSSLHVEVVRDQATYSLLSGDAVQLTHHGDALTVSDAEPVTRPIPAIDPPPAVSQPPGSRACASPAPG